MSTHDPHNPRPKKLLDRVRDRIRVKHYSRRTEEAYVNWTRRYILFHNTRHPQEMGVPKIQAFLTHLAVEGHVAASTQNQAFSAILFLYREVLELELEGRIGAVRVKTPQQIPTVLSKEEVRLIMAQLQDKPWLVVSLLYGSGLRAIEGVRLRVKDLDFARCEITVRAGKGAKDRLTMLPGSVIEPLQAHLRTVKQQHEKDLTEGCGSV
ncbi:MAG: tyrosine-type recombinase/integrase [bacterium]|nr:tyrosine-type recombinase/integrase [bacterium]